MQKNNSFAHLGSSLNAILYGASLESVCGPEWCSLNIPVISNAIEENLSFAISVIKKKNSLSRLLVKLQELNYNLKVKVLFDKYVAFFSSLCTLMVSGPHVQKSKRQS